MQAKDTTSASVVLAGEPRWQLNVTVVGLTTFSASLLFTMASSADLCRSVSSVPLTLQNTRGCPLPEERGRVTIQQCFVCYPLNQLDMYFILHMGLSHT